MKFLYFKDTDVFGPLEASEIAKESCFTENILVCPEDKADQQDAWKFAKEYPEFKEFITQTVSAAPTNQAAHTVVEQDLPALEDTATDSSSFNKDTFFAVGIGGKGVIPSQNKDFTTELVNIPQGYTFHVDYKQNNQIKSQGKDVSSDASKEDISKGNISKNASENTLTMRKIEDTVAQEDSFLEISNNKIISSSDGRVKPTKKNDLVFILSFAVIVVIAIAIFFAIYNNMKKNKEDVSNEVTSEQNLTENDSQSLPSNPLASSAAENANAVQTEKEVTYEDQAIEIVKNTTIKSKGKTIDEYLKELYATDYKCSWSAKPLTQKTYIVEFFASQVRSEPFVYLFRVDVDEKAITGALNNITLDLLA